MAISLYIPQGKDKKKFLEKELATAQNIKAIEIGERMINSSKFNTFGITEVRD